MPEPRLDYLARDYASFRRLLLDLIAQRNPNWSERNPSDIGIALVELLAHEGDHLAYFQDAAANEAYLDTVRQRISARRHARLVDYAMHDGRNAWTFLHLTANAAATLPAGTPFGLSCSPEMGCTSRSRLSSSSEPMAYTMVLVPSSSVRSVGPSTGSVVHSGATAAS